MHESTLFQVSKKGRIEKHLLLALKSRRGIFQQRKEADHKNRDYGSSVCSNYSYKQLSCSSSTVIEYPLERICDLIEESKERRFDPKFCS